MRDQAGKASAAAFTARATSSERPRGTSATGRRCAGSSTSSPRQSAVDPFAADQHASFLSAASSARIFLIAVMVASIAPHAGLSTLVNGSLRLGGCESNRGGRPLLAEEFDACIRPAFHRRCSSVKGTRVRRTARAAGMSGTIVTGSGLSPRRRDSDRACAGQYRALCGKRGNRPKKSDAGTRARRRLSGRTGGAGACLRAHSTRRSGAQRPQPPGHPSRAWQRPQPRPSHSVRTSILRRLKPIARSSPNRDESRTGGRKRCGAGIPVWSKRRM